MYRYPPLKTERVYQHKFETREEAKRSLFEYVEIFYNRQRVHSFHRRTVENRNS
ncbi:MAG: IS3 family transposase [Chlamydiales bacterium]|nr:IS3 family transposase [Chlamydiales bacterium]